VITKRHGDRYFYIYLLRARFIDRDDKKEKKKKKKLTPIANDRWNTRQWLSSRFLPSSLLRSSSSSSGPSYLHAT